MKNIFIKIFILLFSITIIKNTDELALKKEINYCIKDQDCNYMNLCVKNKCLHKPFYPPTIDEYVGTFSIILGSAISNAGGIGGGGLLVPILILILKFGTQEAIPISKLMILTGSLTAFIMGLKNKHPYRNGIPLDLNVGGLLIPMLLFGTMVGVTLNKVMPQSIILISLTIVLIMNTIKTFKKGFILYKKENANSDKNIEKNSEESQFLKSAETDTSIIKLGVVNSVNREILSENSVSEDSESESSRTFKQVNSEFEKDKILFPFHKIILVVYAFVSLIIVSLLKGSEHIKSLINIEPCSSEYWIIYLIYLPIAIWITNLFAEKIMTEYKYRLSINYPYHSSDVKWSYDIIIAYPIYSFFGGIMAGLLGIGGGLIFGPLLLELGLNPIVSTATSNFLVLLTSCSTSLQFILIGAMNYKYGLFCTVCSTLGSYLGTMAIQRLLEKTGRPSVLIFTMAIVEAISSVCIPLHTLSEIQKNVQQNIDIWKFSSPC